MPADLGVQFCMTEFERAHGKDGFSLTSIETIMSVQTGPSGMGGNNGLRCGNCINIFHLFLQKGHFTTYECAVHGIGDVESLRSIRRQVQG